MLRNDRIISVDDANANNEKLICRAIFFDADTPASSAVKFDGISETRWQKIPGT
jgi:hypothetical protein